VGSVRGAVMGEMGESFRLVLWTDMLSRMWCDGRLAYELLLMNNVSFGCKQWRLVTIYTRLMRKAVT
jgi:hypothetical protein